MLFSRFVLLLVTLCLAVGVMACADSLDIRPPMHPQDKCGPVGKRMYYLLERQFGADLREQLRLGSDSCLPERFISVPDGTQYHERDIRTITSLISGGAIALRYGRFDARAAGISRAEAENALVSLIPVFAAHHLSNNPEKKSWWWGSEWQSAFWAAELTRGAWIFHDRLSPDAQKDVARMVSFEADRFLAGPAPYNEFSDTKAEENAWNSQVLVIAACMLPSHPNRAAWLDKANEYMVTAFAAPQDLGRDKVIDGKPLRDWLRGPNVHSDYTLENHNIFHPDYQTTYGLNVDNAIIYGLAGLPVPQSALFNVAECRGITKLFAMPSGCMFYPMSTDWSLHRNDVTVHAQIPGGLIPDSVGARCLVWALDSLQRADQPGPPRNLFGFNFECTPLHVLSNAYMVSRLYGDSMPASDEDALRSLSGTHILPNARLAVCRSMNGMASFSWFNTDRQFCGLIMPMSSSYTTLPGPRSLIGQIGDKMDPIRIVRREIGPLSGGFSVGLVLDRGPEYRVRERIMMLALPDGRVVYGEWFDPVKDSGQVRTGLLYLEDKPFWLQDDKLRIWHPGGVWEGDPGDWTLAGDRAPWLNVDNRLGIVLRGTKGITCSSRQLVLNSSPDGDPPPCMTVVFYPNATRDTTAEMNKLVLVLSHDNGVLLADLGDAMIAFNPTDKPADVLITGAGKLTLRPLRAMLLQNTRTESHVN